MGCGRAGPRDRVPATAQEPCAVHPQAEARTAAAPDATHAPAHYPEGCQRGRAAAPDASRPSSDHARDSAPGASNRLDDALVRFDPRQAGLPEVQKGDASRYVEARRGDRPWLNAVRHAPEEVQRVFAALDQGGGHAHIRHEGWLSPEKSQLRVLYMEDPAQLDSAKRAAGKDGLLPGDKPRYCATMSTAIRDPAAFAVALARGVEHPSIRTVLDTPQPWEEPRPAIVSVPIADLLGPDGHRYCEGYQLAGDDPKQAVHDRGTWRKEMRAGDTTSVPPPLIVPVDFRGRNIQYAFKMNAASEYEIVSMYPAPPDH